MRPIMLLTALLTLSGCAYLQRAAEVGADAQDTALADAEWFICKGASVGAVRRRYGASSDLAAVWRALCLRNRPAVIDGERL